MHLLATSSTTLDEVVEPVDLGQTPGDVVVLSFADTDLAGLYGVATKVLMQAVRRNRSRFPHDFMFRLTAVELTNLRSQFVTSSCRTLRK